MARSKYKVEQKLMVLQRLKENEHTIEERCRMYRLTATTLRIWQGKYETEGIERIFYVELYAKELKEATVQDYLTNGLTIRETLKKYQISGDAVLMRWVRKYTSHSELKGSGKGKKIISKFSDIRKVD